SRSGYRHSSHCKCFVCRDGRTLSLAAAQPARTQARVSYVRRAIQGALMVAGTIHFLPVMGAFGAGRLTSMYRIPFTDPNLIMLMRHRAFMLSLFGGLVLYAVLRPEMRRIGIAIGTVSLASIVGLAWSTGGYNQAVSNVVLADAIAVLCFLLAAALSVIASRGPSSPRQNFAHQQGGMRNSLLTWHLSTANLRSGKSCHRLPGIGQAPVSYRQLRCGVVKSDVWKGKL